MEEPLQSVEEVIETTRYLSKYSSFFRTYLLWVQRVSVALVGCLVVSYVAQFIYPSSLSRPLLSVKGVAVGLSRKDRVQNKLHRLEQQTVNFKLANGQNVSYSIAAIGAGIDSKATDNVMQYTLSERFKPFSLFARHYQGEVPVKIADQQELKFINDFVKQHDIQPQNAKILDDGRSFAMKEHTIGVLYDANTIKNSIKSAALLNNPQIILPSKLVEPEVSNEDVATSYAVLSEATKGNFTVTIEGTAYVADATTVKSWLKPVADDKQGTVEVEYNQQAIKTWLGGIASGLYVAPQAGSKTIRDGVVVSSTPGVSGKRINTEKLAASIVDALSKQRHSTTTTAEAITAAAKIARSYSQTNAGLNSLIGDWAKEHPGGQFGVSVRELGGQGRYASYNADQLFFAASIYKLYVVDYLFGRIEAGNLDPATTLGSNRSVDDCINAIILVSDNACPEGVANAVGWGTLNASAHNITGGVSLVGGNIKVSANGAADFMVKLYDGQLMSASNTNRLLGLMKNQKYRQAIPAGSRGATVADKVGFYGGSWHDVGIVYGAKSTYVLSVMSKGASYTNIADLAGKIYDLLN